MEALEKAKEYMKGTTTVGVACNDGIVLASDKRATMGTLIAHKIVQKSFKIDEHIGATVAGSVADAQALIRWIQAEAKIFRMRTGREMSVDAVATLMANILFQQRYYPMIVQLIVGGVDSRGNKIYSLDPLGSLIEDKVVATGSGSPVAYGVLDDGFEEDMAIDDCVKLCVRALRSALERDAMTGNGIDVVKITKEGWEKLPEEEVTKILEAI
ncbi:MAG: archaeal proteasome endopeptidase complex subunit beta [Euryarchaeota archaeon]|nr:archaeal proteasome endopeptidase complex subunit beta [Euryarchaeota archaeon]